MSASETRRNLAQHNRLPKLDATFRLTRHGLGRYPGQAFDAAYGEACTSWTAALEFEYPLGKRTAKAELITRNLEYDQSRTEVQRIRDQTLTEVRLALRELTLAQEEIPAALKAKLAAGRVVKAEQARFELAQKTNEELLRAQDLLAAASREYARAVLSYNIALVAFARAKGTIPKELGIEVLE